MGIRELVRDWLEVGSVELLDRVADHLLNSPPAAEDACALELLQHFGMHLAPSFHCRGVRAALEDLGLSAQAYARVLAEIEGLQEGPQPGHRIKVDRDRRFFIHLESHTKTLSEPMARVLALLSESQSASFETLLSVGYGLFPYDPWIHDVKIHNLLHRLKQFTRGDLEIKTRNRIAYLVHGHDRIFVQKRSLLHSQCLELNSKMRSRALSPSRYEFIKEALLQNGALTRRQIQDLAGLSKSTSQRVLNRLIAVRAISKIGRGPRAIYQLLRPSIQESPHLRKQSEYPQPSDTLEQRKKGGKNDP